MKQIGDRQVYTVTEINRIAKQVLQEISVWIEGEISKPEYKNTYYYYYFDLKDSETEFVIPCITNPALVNSLDFEFKHGVKVLLYGNLSLYEKRGGFQFNAKKIEALGEGILQKKLDELKKKLQQEGLFDEQHKKPIPVYPLKIGVITSIQDRGAAWLDFKSHSIDKFPFLEITVRDVFVQGDKAPRDISEAIEQLDGMGLDVIVITRGGGSQEDLMAYNTEEVARAIYLCRTPIISAVGHEKDVSIADLVADMRASTPTAAATLLVSNYPLYFQTMDELYRRSIDRADYLVVDKFELLDQFLFKLQLIKSYYKDLPGRLKTCETELKRFELLLVQSKRELLDTYAKKLQQDSQLLYRTYEMRMKTAKEKLRLLSPESALSRGYSIVKGQNGKIVKSSEQVAIGEDITVQLHNGKLLSQVKKRIQDGSR